MALRRKIQVGDAWSRDNNKRVQIFIVSEILHSRAAEPVVLTDITGLFRSAVSHLEYFRMTKNATPLSQKQVDTIRELLGQNIQS